MRRVNEHTILKCVRVGLCHQCCFFLSNKLTGGDGVKMIKDGACHSLIIGCCSKDDSAVYRFEAEGRKSEATLDIKGQKKIQKCFKLTEGLSIIAFLFKKKQQHAFSFFKRPTKG